MLPTSLSYMSPHPSLSPNPTSTNTTSSSSRTPAQSSLWLVDAIPAALVAIYVLYILFRYRRYAFLAIGALCGRLWYGKGGARGEYVSVNVEDEGIDSQPMACTREEYEYGDGQGVLGEGEESGTSALASRRGRSAFLKPLRIPECADRADDNEDENDVYQAHEYNTKKEKKKRQMQKELEPGNHPRTPLDISKYFDPTTSRIKRQVLFSPETGIECIDRDIDGDGKGKGSGKQSVSVSVRRLVDRAVDATVRWFEDGEEGGRREADGEWEDEGESIDQDGWDGDGDEDGEGDTEMVRLRPLTSP
ncbi:hypothetical protein AJ80_03851 [Polytolypa hystricis UAMH7299]|uniref:Uncharacterized protein n=1 Tax=Polytolypa hystricis (strain UAMH7299) TaxID=1447883 RepID=A0A2B7YDT4_POLH7|nr:hypothetical protein AJ80_03851 [Polytolypa hystricis UAMH7299]